MGMQQRSVDLLVDLMDAEQHFDEVTRDELRKLISEAVIVFSQIVIGSGAPDAGHTRHAEVLLQSDGVALALPLGELSADLFKRHA